MKSNKNELFDKKDNNIDYITMSDIVLFFL
jgi:hypothetical protein